MNMVVYMLEQRKAKWAYDRFTENADEDEAHFDLGGYVNKQN